MSQLSHPQVIKECPRFLCLLTQLLLCFSQGCTAKRCIRFPIRNYPRFFFSVSFQYVLRRDQHGPSHPHGDYSRASFCSPPLPLQAILHPTAWVVFKKAPPCLKHSGGFPCTRRKSEQSTLPYRALTEFLHHDHLRTWSRAWLIFYLVQ